MSLITFITDFGIKDPYVAMVKGVILKINPSVKFIDITNEVAPGDLVSASFILGETYQYFPPGSVHLVLVDPTVGSKRRAIFSFKDGHFFVGPDNGVLTPGLSSVFKIKEKIGRKSNTFDGRELFAEVAARLSLGEKMEILGEEIKDPVRISIPKPKEEKDKIIGEVIYIDRFGNLISNINGDKIKKNMEIEIKGIKIKGLSKNYSEGKENELIALVNDGFRKLEISLNRKSAASFLGVKVGEKIIVRGENG
ncbi:MAG: SAM-dependent chlorinase/fluorinase [candidate division WOR-3 bacterium]